MKKKKKNEIYVLEY
jgi:hypothetical protein